MNKNVYELDCHELGCSEESQRNCTETGTCAVHGVEIERRRDTEKVLSRITGIMIVSGVLITAAFGFAASAFIYTNAESKAATQDRQLILEKTDANDRRFEMSLNQLTNQVLILASSVNKTVSKSEEREEAIVQQLKELNDHIGRRK